jgi:hypothetical protein
MVESGDDAAATSWLGSHDAGDLVYLKAPAHGSPSPSVLKRLSTAWVKPGDG